MSDYLPCVEVNPAGEANASIIWLHGLGANGHDFEPLVPQLQLKEELALRFVFPHAPSIPITINNNYVMPAWFDVTELGQERAFNAHQMAASVAAVHALIDREIERGIPSDRIIITGFSQGGAVCFQAALTYDKPLAGLMGLSTWFPTADVVEVHPANAGLPVMLCHGSDDNVLPMQMALNARKYLEGLNFHPEFITYPMQHHVCPEEVEDIAGFINRHL